MAAPRALEQVTAAEKSSLATQCTDLDDFNEVLGTHLVTDLTDMPGGYIYGMIGRVPTDGEQAQVEDGWPLSRSAGGASAASTPAGRARLPKPKTRPTQAQVKPHCRACLKSAILIKSTGGGKAHPAAVSF